MTNRYVAYLALRLITGWLGFCWIPSSTARLTWASATSACSSSLNRRDMNLILSTTSPLTVEISTFCNSVIIENYMDFWGRLSFKKTISQIDRDIGNKNWEIQNTNVISKLQTMTPADPFFSKILKSLHPPKPVSISSLLKNTMNLIFGPAQPPFSPFG